MIKNDGLKRVAQLNQSGVRFYQFLPLYDVIHLGNILARGYAPTSGEMSWALIDGCFVITDVLSLAALQPEGAVASEAARGQIKIAAREGARSAGRRLAAQGTESAGKSLSRHEAGLGLEHAAAQQAKTVAGRLARWWTVRSAGGTYQVLRRIPEALPHLTLPQMTQLARPLCARAGMRLSSWHPVRLLREGTEVVLRIPPQKGLKYVAAQAVQAGVGVIGFHKMEEYLASRRPQKISE
jgi:hypothetical protein